MKKLPSLVAQKNFRPKKLVDELKGRVKATRALMRPLNLVTTKYDWSAEENSFAQLTPIRIVFNAI